MLNDKGNQRQKSFRHLAYLVFSEEGCYVFLIIEFILSEEYVTQSSQSNENASLPSLHTSYIYCAVELLLTFGTSSNDSSVLNLYQHILLERRKIYHLRITRSIRC